MSFWGYMTALSILAGLILVHEIGHYVAARRAGIAVPEFSLGFGPRLCSFQARGTAWTVRAIPLLGYCRFAEEGVDGWDLASLSARARVMLAGPIANLLLFVLLLPVAARLAGLPWAHVPATTASWGSIIMSDWVEGIGQLMQGRVSEVSGPVAIAATTAQVARSGGLYLTQLVARLSLNLALVNLLPLPIFDGGRLLMLALEWVRGRRLRAEVEGWILSGSAVVMLVLAVLLVAKDVVTLVG